MYCAPSSLLMMIVPLQLLPVIGSRCNYKAGGNREDHNTDGNAEIDRWIVVMGLLQHLARQCGYAGVAARMLFGSAAQNTSAAPIVDAVVVRGHGHVHDTQRRRRKPRRPCRWPRSSHSSRSPQTLRG